MVSFYNGMQYISVVILVGAFASVSLSQKADYSEEVGRVSWNEVVQDFVPWLNQETGRNYRLPTEAEWEYAARAGTTTKYSWGNEIDCSQARYGFHVDQYGKANGTLPVKSFKPNGLGLYDMHGNVWEFVQDYWDEGECNEIVLRGGSWLNEPLYLGSAARYRHDRTYRESGDGFRLAHDMN